METKYLNRCFSYFAMIFFIQQSVIANESQFDSGFLFGNHSNIDLSKFNKSDYVQPGLYSLDIYLNDKYIVNAFVNVSYNLEKPENIDACLSYKTMALLDLKNEVIENSIIKKMNV